jgi:hypothetical protein
VDLGVLEGAFDVAAGGDGGDVEQRAGGRCPGEPFSHGALVVVQACDAMDAHPSSPCCAPADHGHM